MKILLLSPTMINKKSSGALMLCDLVSLIKKDQIFLFAAYDPRLGKIESMKFGAISKSQFVKRPIESPYSFPNWFFDKPLSNILERYKEINIRKNIIAKTVDFGRKNKVDCVWAILQGKTMIEAAMKISKTLKVPLLSQVWDEPEWILSETKINAEAKEKLLRQFDKTIKSSSGFAAASEIMAQNYQKKYHVKTAVFLGSLPQKEAQKPALQLNPGIEFKIGFAGQLYAEKEWQSLMMAFESVNWQIANRNIKIYLLGDFKLNKNLKGKIINLGRKSRIEVIKTLAKTDLLYLPYWFDREHKKIAQTSFPSKLTTYLASGRPVFFHGPTYASPALFIKKNRCGILCHSLESSDIIRQIRNLIKDKNKYRRLSKNGTLAFNRFLTYKNLKEELEKFFDFARRNI